MRNVCPAMQDEQPRAARAIIQPERTRLNANRRPNVALAD